MSLLEHLDVWMLGKSTIFASEQYAVSISPSLGEQKKAKYIEVDSKELIGRATLWEDGSLELEALDQLNGKTAIQASRLAHKVAELEDCLNWWLSEIAIYARPQT